MSRTLGNVKGTIVRMGREAGDVLEQRICFSWEARTPVLVLFQASCVITEDSPPLLGKDFLVRPVKSWPTRILHSLQAQTLYKSVVQGLRDLTTCKESRWQLRKVNSLNTKFDRNVPFPVHKPISRWGAVIGQDWSNLVGVLEAVKLLLSKCLVNSLVLEEV